MKRSYPKRVRYGKVSFKYNFEGQGRGIEPETHDLWSGPNTRAPDQFYAAISIPWIPETACTLLHSRFYQFQWGDVGVSAFYRPDLSRVCCLLVGFNLLFMEP